MAHVRLISVNSTDNNVPLEENKRILENTSYIRENEVEVLRHQVTLIENQLEELTLEYKEFLEDNDFVDSDIETDSVIYHGQFSELYEEESFSGTNYVNRKTVLIPNPTFMPLSVAIEEGNLLLGPLGRRIEWFQNEIMRKYILKVQIMKRIEDIESRENNF